MNISVDIIQVQVEVTDIPVNKGVEVGDSLLSICRLAPSELTRELAENKDFLALGPEILIMYYLSEASESASLRNSSKLFP